MENEAATDIQKIWRGYRAHMEMSFSLVQIIVAQSVARWRLAIVKYEPMKLGHQESIVIQKNVQRHIVRKDYIV